MNRILIGALLILCISWNSDKTPPEYVMAGIDTHLPTMVAAKNGIEIPWAHPHPYELKFEMSTLENDLYDLVVSVQLNDGAYFVSPNAKRDFSGKFTIQLDDADALKPISDLVETPRSVEEYDPHPFVDGYVNWVREDTRYNQKLKRTAEGNFHVKGLIRFTIEPRCTLEEIPFIIKYEEGAMRVELFGC